MSETGSLGAMWARVQWIGASPLASALDLAGMKAIFRADACSRLGPMVSPCFFALIMEDAPAQGASQGLLLLGLGLLAGILIAIVALLLRLSALEKRLGPLAALGEIDAKLKAMSGSQANLELRRLEHLLVDIRDGHKRVDQRLAQVLENREREPASESDGQTPGPTRLADRIINRLLSQGYERIEILTPAKEFEQMLNGEGEVRVEARRGGAAYKGRVKVRAGLILEVQLRAPFEIFP